MSTALEQPRRASQRGEPPWDIALLYPPQGKWTEADYLALKTNRLVELSDGCLEILPMASILHQLIAQFLFKLLDAFISANRSGLVLMAPLPVRLWPGTLRQPDVVYLRPERIRDVRGQPDGADLVMEVVSPGEENRQRDLTTKRREYAAAGIAEYWIIDPEERQIVVLTLAGDEYREHGTFKSGERATSVLLPGFSADVDEVFAAGEAGPNG